MTFKGSTYIIEPQTAHAIPIKAQRIWRSIRFRIVDRCQEGCRRIEDVRRYACVRRFERRHLLRQGVVVLRNGSRLLALHQRALGRDVGRVLDRRDGQEQELARAGVVQGLRLVDVLRHNLVQRRGPGRGVPPVADVINAHPDCEEGVRGGPFLEVRNRLEALLVLGYLVDEGENRGGVWGDEVSVCRGAAIGEVVGVDWRAVEG